VYLTGDGLCSEICPELFGPHDDGLWHVKEASWPTIYGPEGETKDEPVYKMGSGMADVPDEFLATAIEAAEDCPGECIMIEVIED